MTSHINHLVVSLTETIIRLQNLTATRFILKEKNLSSKRGSFALHPANRVDSNEFNELSFDVECIWVS